MIKTIRGKTTHQLQPGIVVEVSGLGYLVIVPIRSVPNIGAEVFFYTYHHIREDNQALFGFETLAELEVFEALLTVPSIGPKLAMTIMSAATPDDISSAVATDNVGFFKSLPGVGGKSAAKIIVELKDKLTSGGLTSIPSAGTQLADALVSLGYSPQEVQAVLREAPTDLSINDQVSWSLKWLAKR